MRERSIATVLVWITYLTMVWLSIDKLAVWSLALAFVLMIPLIIMTGGMWGMFNDDEGEKATTTQNQQNVEALEKRKRDRIDRVLRDLSDDDLVRLRDRLGDGTIDDEGLYHMLGDDGEIVYRNGDEA